MAMRAYRWVWAISTGTGWLVICAGLLWAAPLEQNINLPGMDYKNFNLPSPDPRLCQEACAADVNCRAFTYVKPGIQGREARCWLKSGVPRAVRDACCVSGVKTAETKSTPPDTVRQPVPVAKPQAPVTSRAQQPVAGQAERIPAPSIEQKPIVPPTPGPRLQQFQVSVSNQIHALNARERRRAEDRIEEVRRAIQSPGASGSAPSMKPGVATQPSYLPQITYVYPTKVTPGTPILLQGSGFPAQPGVVLYDPTGDWLGLGTDGTASNSVRLEVTKASPTSIEAKVPEVVEPGVSSTHERLSPIKGPRQVFIRIWDAAKKQYGSPSPPILLEPIMAIYVCAQGPCFPVNIEKNGTQVVWQPGHAWEHRTGTVFHFVPDGSINKGTDLLVQNLKTPKGWTLAGFSFDYEYFCYDQKTGTYGPPISPGSQCTLAKSVTLDQNVSKIDGETLLPKVTVSWEAGHYGGIAYSYAIYMLGPEGLASIPFP